MTGELMVMTPEDAEKTPVAYDGQVIFISKTGERRVGEGGRWVEMTAQQRERHELLERRRSVAGEVMAENPELDDLEAMAVAASRVPRPGHEAHPINAESLLRLTRSPEMAALTTEMHRLQEAYERMHHALEEIANVLGTDYDDQQMRHAWGELRQKSRGVLDAWGGVRPSDGMRPA